MNVEDPSSVVVLSLKDDECGLSETDRCLRDFQASIGAEKYVTLHKKIVYFFAHRKCGARCEALADIALDRVARKFAAGEAPPIDRIDAYVLHSGRYIFLEDLRRCGKDRELVDQLKREPPRSTTA